MQTNVKAYLTIGRSHPTVIRLEIQRVTISRESKCHFCQVSAIWKTNDKTTSKEFDIIFLHFLDKTVKPIRTKTRGNLASIFWETYPNWGWWECDKICLAAEVNSLAKYLHHKNNSNAYLQRLTQLTQGYWGPACPWHENLSLDLRLGILQS